MAYFILNCGLMNQIILYPNKEFTNNLVINLNLSTLVTNYYFFEIFGFLS